MVDQQMDVIHFPIKFHQFALEVLAHLWVVLRKSDLRIFPGFGFGAAAVICHILGRVGANGRRRIRGRMPGKGVQSVFMQRRPPVQRFPGRLRGSPV